MSEKPSLPALESKLHELESIALNLEPGEAARAELWQKTNTYAESFLQQIDDLPAFVETTEKGAGIRGLAIEESGHSLDQLLDLVKKEVDHPGLNPASGGHLGYIPGGGLYPTALGDFLADVANRYSGVFFASPGAVRMENMMVDWMCQLVGYDQTASGTLTSGGSIANLTALVTARDAKDIKARDIERSVIYLTAQVHHCVGKAIRIAGLREAQVRKVPMDAHFRMDPQALTQLVEEDLKNGLKPFLVVASAGTTDTGAVDPISAIADICEAHDLWFHVDGAYGGFFLLAEEVSHLLTDIHRADSIVLDPHKGLFLAYGSGALLVKNRKWLFESHYYQANYMQDTLRAQEETSPADHSAELTRPFRGMRMWLPLMLFGLAPFRAGLSEKIWLTRYFYEKVQEIPGMEVGAYPQLSVMMFRYVPTDANKADAFNAQLTQAIQEEGTVFLSSTNIKGVFWIRLAVLSFRTHRKTIDAALRIIGEKVKELTQTAL